MTDILKIKQNGQWVGIPAIKGDTGQGVASGGTTGQILKKKSNTDYDTEWGTITQPTKLSDLADDTSTNPIDKADTLTDLTATVSELNYMDGVTSNVQTQLDSKQDELTGLTATVTELNYCDGVTSNIQTQLDGKQVSGDYATNTALNQKADSSIVDALQNATNFTATGKSTLSGLGMPSSRYTQQALGASGSVYTAPANGYFCVGGGTSTSRYGAISFEMNKGLYQQIHVSDSGQYLGLVRPVMQGDTLQVNYGDMSGLTLYFCYAEGNK